MNISVSPVIDVFIDDWSFSNASVMEDNRFFAVFDGWQSDGSQDWPKDIIILVAVDALELNVVVIGPNM